MRLVEGSSVLQVFTESSGNGARENLLEHRFSRIRIWWTICKRYSWEKDRWWSLQESYLIIYTTTFLINLGLLNTWEWVLSQLLCWMNTRYKGERNVSSIAFPKIYQSMIQLAKKFICLIDLCSLLIKNHIIIHALIFLFLSKGSSSLLFVFTKS